MSLTPVPKLNLEPAALDRPSRIHLIEIECLMLWPDDSILREQALDSMMVQRSVDVANAGHLSNEAVLALANIAAATIPMETIEVRRKERMQRGLYCGQILFKAIGQAVIGRDSSLGRIMSEVTLQYRGRETSSKAVNTEIWNPFRPVAHFWAAHYFYLDRGIDGFPCQQNRLPLFLAIAEDFRRRGESLKLKPQAPTPILPAGQSVVLPPGFNLPRGRMIFEDIH